MSDIREELNALAAGTDGVEAIEDLRDDPSFRATPASLHGFVKTLRDEPKLQFKKLVLITACDNYLAEPRFDVTYRLRSLERNQDLRINVAVGGEEPTLATVTDLYKTANWLEREVYDMFGVRFDGHPSLTRILMWEGFEGYPLRKDYPLLGNTLGTPGYTGKGGKA